MDSKTIKKFLANEYTDMQKEVYKTMLKKIYKDYDRKNFTTKDPHDKMRCIVCGGKYTRNTKSTHVKTLKHKERENELFDWFKEIYLHKLLIQ
jgi:hypothetical protein